VRSAPLLAALLACACGDAGKATDTAGGDSGSTGVVEIDGTMVELVEPTVWQPLAAANDPFADHRPATVDCAFGLGWVVEPTGVEINTATCNYGALVQPSLQPVVRGAQLSLQLYHFDLVAAEPATAHVAVLIGEHKVFEREVAIPGKADVYEVDLVADFDAPAGTPVVLHLHNHGQNTWTLGDFLVEVAATENK
jgi:hypothetical protein